MFRIDHVVLAVADLEASAARMWDDHGLRFVRGGRHPRWGTANMICPLGADYLELLSVVDRDVAADTVLGRTLTELATDGDRWFSACLTDAAIEDTAARLGLTVQPGARTRPDGIEVRWRGAGIEDRGPDLWLPFFIAWDVPPALHPGATPAEHRAPVGGIAWVEVGGDRGRLDAWLDGEEAPIRVVEAEPGVRATALRLADGGEMVLGS